MSTIEAILAGSEWVSFMHVRVVGHVCMPVAFLECFRFARYMYLLHTSPAHCTFSYDAKHEISAHITHLILHATHRACVLS